MEHILSFDVAKGKSVYCLIDSNKNTIIDSTSINHLKNEFDNLYSIIKDDNSLTVVIICPLFKGLNLSMIFHPSHLGKLTLDIPQYVSPPESKLSGSIQ